MLNLSDGSDTMIIPSVVFASLQCQVDFLWIKVMGITKSKAKIGVSLVIVFFVTLHLGCCSVHNLSKCEDRVNTTCNANQLYSSRTGRIPPNLVPINYKIRVQPFVNGNLSIHGSVAMTFTVVNPTNKIILNLVDIITRNETCKVEPASKSPEETIQVVNQTYERYYHQYTVEVKDHLTVGQNYTIYVEFEGFLNSKLVGFYLSTYEDELGVTRRVAATQFSPTDARKAFPCMDEPGFKATFDITLVREKNMTSWAGMPLVSSVPVPGHPDWFEDHFNTTPIMSTYLVGFLIADFIQQPSDFLNSTQFSVLTRPTATNQTEYASFLGQRSLLFLEDYFQIPFPLPKLDMAAIPDFKFNGMENWGLIMYREKAMLFDPETTTVSAQRGIAQVICHEIAHQWFGNLVTPVWWSDLWLKEGFANFMGYMAADGVEPTWAMMDYLMYGTMRSALELDSFSSTHPINVEVDHADRISEIFDQISYDKGASIIRMMFHFLGEVDYRKGMTAYLNGLKYKNANQDQLWQFLTEAWTSSSSHDSLSVKNVMDTWTLQEGYPLVLAERNGSTIIFQQERFFMKGNSSNATTNDAGNSTWWIPLSFTFGGEENFEHTLPQQWMTPDEKMLSINTNASNDNKWLLVNIQRTGFYRVNYDQRNWDLLISQLLTNMTTIHPLNRAQLVEDSLNLARAGYLPYSTALDVTKFLSNETSLAVWISFLHNFKYIYHQVVYSDEGQLPALQRYLKDLIIPVYEKLGFEDQVDDDYSVVTLRSLSSWWACTVGHTPCIESARSFFQKWLSNPKDASLISVKNSKATVLCTGIKEGSETIWNSTFQNFINSDIQTEQVDILRYLGCTKDEKILSRYLAMVFEENSHIKRQDASTVFKAVSRTKIGRTLAWNELKNKWETIIQQFGSGSPLIWRMLQAPTLTFGSQSLLEELREFETLTEDTIGSAKQTLSRSIEGAALNVLWKDNLFPQITTWLQQNCKE